MKRIAVLLTAVAALALAAGNIKAQQTNAPTGPTAQNFFQSAEGYLSTFTTNGVWTNTTVEIAVGADYQQGIQWANDLEVQYDIKGGNWGVGYRMRNAGIAGVIEANEAKVEYSLVSYLDTRVEVSLYAGYDNAYNAAIFEPQIELRKKLTANTFAGIYLSEPVYVGHHAPAYKGIPNVGLDAGCTL